MLHLPFNVYVTHTFRKSMHVILNILEIQNAQAWAFFDAGASA
jgi:hypothetical protein